MVNIHGKYTNNAVNNAAYRSDGSDVRDATAEEKLRYLDANKHKRKKATSAVSSAEISKSDTAVDAEIPVKSHPVFTRGKQSLQDTSSGDRCRSDSRSEKGRERSDRNEEREISGKSSDRSSSRKIEGQKSECRARATEDEEGIDNEEADQRMMIKIQDRIEARKVAREQQLRN